MVEDLIEGFWEDYYGLKICIVPNYTWYYAKYAIFQKWLKSLFSAFQVILNKVLGFLLKKRIGRFALQTICWCTRVSKLSDITIAKPQKGSKLKGRRLTQNDLEVLWYNLTRVKGDPLLLTLPPLNRCSMFICVHSRSQLLGTIWQTRLF